MWGLDTQRGPQRISSTNPTPVQTRSTQLLGACSVVGSSPSLAPRNILKLFPCGFSSILGVCMDLVLCALSPNKITIFKNSWEKQTNKKIAERVGYAIYFCVCYFWFGSGNGLRELRNWLKRFSLCWLCWLAVSEQAEAGRSWKAEVDLALQGVARI